MTPRHAILIAIAALTLAACTPQPERATLVPLDEQLCWIIDADRLREVPCR